MDVGNQTVCPLVDGYCLYERCPYWDAARQECDADCLKSPEAAEPNPSLASPCITRWTEDWD